MDKIEQYKEKPLSIDVITMEFVYALCPDSEIRSLFMHLYERGQIEGCTIEELQVEVEGWLSRWRNFPKRPHPDRPTKKALGLFCDLLHIILHGEPAPNDFAKGFGYLYLIRSGAYYKIGFTTDVLRRVQELQIGNSQKVKIEDYVIALAPRGVERELHNHFANRSVRGEWYRLRKEDIEQIRSWLRVGVPTIL